MRKYLFSRRFSLFGLVLFVLLFTLGRVYDWPTWAYFIGGFAATLANDWTIDI